MGDLRSRSDGTDGGIVIAAARLERAVAAVFRAAGSEPAEAALVAHHLVGANLSGHDSHGVGLLRGYLAAVDRGDLRLNQRLATVRDSGSLLVLEGRRGAGAAMASAAMARGIERAHREGHALVALRDSYHIGRIGAWAEQCAAAGLVSIHFVNVPAHAAVAPFGGTRARLGTNPFAAGFPRPGAAPVVVDFATSRWAVGKVQVANRRGDRLPPGILLDASGRGTDDPAALYGPPPGALLPFGDHKGFGLALACELLAGAVTGGLTQDGTPSEAITNSMLSIIVLPEALGANGYAAALEGLLAWVTAEGTVRLPGEPEEARRAAQLLGGIAIDPVTWSDMKAAAEGVGIDDLAAAGG
jgi:uncharacterized oxidoreductase